MDAEELLKNRIKELAEKSYQQSIYCHTSFLGLPEQSLYYQVEREVSYAHASFDGGYEEAERKVLIFGSEELFGYEGVSPICCLFIRPISLKFCETLSHRDYLGAILNLGIERECLGDILVEDTGAYLFCMENMADFLCEHITKIRHTLVSVSKVEAVQMQIRPKLKPVEGFLSSFRLDAVISLGFSLSRKESALFIKNKKVFVNGRLIENAGRQVAEGDVISVRGKGKMQFNEIRGQSKKGRYSVLLYQYV